MDDRNSTSTSGRRRRRNVSIFVPGFLRSETATMYGLLTALSVNDFHKGMMIMLMLKERIPDFIV